MLHLRQIHGRKKQGARGAGAVLNIFFPSSRHSTVSSHTVRLLVRYVYSVSSHTYFTYGKLRLHTSHTVSYASRPTCSRDVCTGRDWLNASFLC